MDIRLQQQMRQDPSSYADVYKEEAERLRSLIKLSKRDPGIKIPGLPALLVSLSTLSKHFKESIAGDLFEYSVESFKEMDRSLRQAAVTAIVNLKKSKEIDAEVFYRRAIPLVEEMDRRTKTIFIQFLVSELMREKGEWPAAKKIFSCVIDEGTEAHSKRASYIYTHMVSRGAWGDRESAEKVFQMVVNGCVPVVRFVSLYLLDRIELTVKEEEIDEGEGRKTSKIKRRTRADERREKREKMGRERRRKGKVEERSPNICRLLEVLGEEGKKYALGIFKRLKKEGLKLDLKLRLAQIVSRIVSFHRLKPKDFLSHMTRFMFPHQRMLPIVLSCIVESIHEESDLREVEGVCKIIVENFCRDYCDDEIIAYGVNAVRMILRRNRGVARFKCIEEITDYRRIGKQQAVAAGTALRKMVRAVEEQKEEELESESLPHEKIQFVSEENIKEIRKKKSKEEIVEGARQSLRKEKKSRASTNKEKQKEKNHAVRRGKRQLPGKKLRRKSRKKAQ
jgi:hypothetical protein